MELFEAMQKRRSVRRYTDEPISAERLERLLEAGLLAPSSRNKKPCELIALQEKGLLEKLSHTKSAGSAMLKDAAAAIVVIADSEKSDVWVEDASIVLTYLHLAATDLGFGSCWIQCRNRKTASDGDSEDYVRDTLSIPDRYRIVGILSLGMAKEMPEPHLPGALDRQKLHFERY